MIMYIYILLKYLHALLYYIISIEQLPTYALLGFFEFVFLPMAIHDVNMFRGSFSYGRTLSITLILSIVCMTLYLSTNFIPNYYCTSISKYMPKEL